MERPIVSVEAKFGYPLILQNYDTDLPSWEEVESAREAGTRVEMPESGRDSYEDAPAIGAGLDASVAFEVLSRQWGSMLLGLVAGGGTLATAADISGGFVGAGGLIGGRFDTGSDLIPCIAIQTKLGFEYLWMNDADVLYDSPAFFNDTSVHMYLVDGIALGPGFRLTDGNSDYADTLISEPYVSLRIDF